ncbi:MAG TPA: TCR/Tet family MFS transporter [Chitinophagaceae bacterium]|nr:TCR/Tet family MFS transporter [Chitinophagaceae bacterium]
MKSSRKAAVGFIFVTLLIDIMGWGLIIPVMPTLISQLKGIPVNEASPYGAWLVSAYAITQFIFGPIIGNLSDKYGRRPVLLFSLFGFAIDYLFMALVPTYGLLFVGRIISGITGASITTASAYIADISTNENRAKNFGMIGAAFGIGFIAGPALGGLLAGWGVRAPFYAAAALCLLNALYGYFVLPESLSVENRRHFHWKKINPLGGFQFIRKHKAIIGLACCYFLLYLGAQSVMANWSYYTIYKFGWREKMVGISLAAVGLVVGVVQAGLTRVITPRLGNEKTIYLGMSFYITGLILFAIATESWMMFAFILPYCMGGLAGPALQSTLTAHIPRNEQGALQGALSSLMSLTTIIGPLIMNNLFEFFTTDKAPFHFPGMPFLLGAVFMLISLFIARHVLSKERKTDPVLAKIVDAKSGDDSPGTP